MQDTSHHYVVALAGQAHAVYSYNNLKSRCIVMYCILHFYLVFNDFISRLMVVDL